MHYIYTKKSSLLWFNDLQDGLLVYTARLDHSIRDNASRWTKRVYNEPTSIHTDLETRGPSL